MKNTPPAPNLLNSRRARVLDLENHYPCDEPGEHHYIGPERTDIALEGIDCTLNEFYEWFLKTEVGDDFCVSDEVLIDIGGSRLDLSPGNILLVSFQDVLNKQINDNAHYSKSLINDMSTAALSSIY